MSGGGLVLLYHRVAESVLDPQLLAVSPRRFAEHLEILRRTASPMSLREMSAAAQEGRLPPRAVALTFDDGYRDNLENAKPLLERSGIPATVFVATGYLNGTRELWWDALERIFLSTARLPESLHLQTGDQRFCWQLGESAFCGEAELNGITKWNVLSPACPSARARLYASLCDLLRPLRDSERERLLEELSRWSSVRRTPRSSHRIMSREDVGRLCSGGLIDVGAHTVTHPVLSAISPEEQAWELAVSRSSLEGILDRPVVTLSYPYGTRKDYTATTIRLAREAGYDQACANFRGLVRGEVDAFQWPRIVVRDWDADTFARRIDEEWSGG